MSNARFFPLDSRAETTALKQPKELCSYSRTFDGSYINDDSCLSYFFLPDSDIDTNIDLSAGFSKFKKIDEEQDGKLDGLLSAIKNYEERKDTKVKADIITWRGIMTSLLILPYEQRNHIDLNIVYFDEHIFMQQVKKSPNQQNTKPTAEHERLMYSGYKFESIATVPKPLSEVSRATIEKRNKKVVNNIEQYSSVVRTGIGKTKIILGGEVDCVWDYKPNDENPLSHYVELKTSTQISNPGQSVTFEKKLFKTWAQCFLLGITKIIYGFRDENLVLRSVEEYKTEEIPVILKSNPVNTNPRKINCLDCLKWYGALVEWIKAQIPEDESKAWRLTFDPSKKTLVLYELPPDLSNEALNGGILTEEFKQWRLQKRE
jgi:RAT1-interacting protein